MNRWAAIATIGAAATIAGAASVSPVATLAGRYSHHFANGLVTGESYESDDVAEIVPVDATHAYLRFELAFFNGHSCSLSGVATAKGDALVYTEPAGANLAGEERCTLTVRRHGRVLAWDDGGTCKSYCGARGSFSGGDLPWASKRPIRYMARLTNSSEYKSAIIEWKTGKRP